MLIEYSYVCYVHIMQITKCVSCIEKFLTRYHTIPLILYVRYFLYHDLSYSIYTNKYHCMIRYNHVHTLGFSIDGNKCTKNRNSIDTRNRLNLFMLLFMF